MLTEGLVRLEYSEEGNFEDRPTQTVLNRDFPSCTYTVKETEEEIQVFTKRIHLIYNKKEFKGHSLSNILFKQGYIVPILLNNKKYDFNYVAEASEGQSIVHDLRNNSLTIRNMLNLSLDINSRQGAGYVFGEKEMEEFFNNAADYGKQFLDYYLG